MEDGLTFSWFDGEEPLSLTDKQVVSLQIFIYGITWSIYFLYKIKAQPSWVGRQFGGATRVQGVRQENEGHLRWTGG